MSEAKRTVAEQNEALGTGKFHPLAGAFEDAEELAARAYAGMAEMGATPEEIEKARELVAHDNRCLSPADIEFTVTGAGLVACGHCGGLVATYKQWRGGFRTCLSCTIEIHAIIAAHLVCGGCLIGRGLVSPHEKAGKTHHRSGETSGRLQPCWSIGIRRYFGLGDGPLTDWREPARQETGG